LIFCYKQIIATKQFQLKFICETQYLIKHIKQNAA